MKKIPTRRMPIQFGILPKSEMEGFITFCANFNHDEITWWARFFHSGIPKNRLDAFRYSFFFTLDQYKRRIYQIGGYEAKVAHPSELDQIINLNCVALRQVSFYGEKFLQFRLPFLYEVPNVIERKRAILDQHPFLKIMDEANLYRRNRLKFGSSDLFYDEIDTNLLYEIEMEIFEKYYKRANPDFSMEIILIKESMIRKIENLFKYNPLKPKMCYQA